MDGVEERADAEEVALRNGQGRRARGYNPPMARSTPMRPKARHPVRVVGVAVLALVAVLSLAGGCGLPTRLLQNAGGPNIVLILTDDLDAGLLQRYGERYPNIS